MTYPGAHGLKHQWAFIPDFAEAHVAVYERSAQLSACETFHFGGHVLTGVEWIALVRNIVGDPNRKVKSLPWTLLGMLGWFQPVMRELKKMRYLWDEELTLDGRRLERLLGGAYPTTTARAAILKTLEAAGFQSTAGAVAAAA